MKREQSQESTVLAWWLRQPRNRVCRSRQHEESCRVSRETATGAHDSMLAPHPLMKIKAPDGPPRLFALSVEQINGLIVHELVHALDVLCMD